MSAADALGKLDLVLEWIHQLPVPTRGATPNGIRVTEARAAVAELIRRSDETVKAFEALGRTNNIVAQLESHRECERALVAQKAAVAGCKGEANPSAAPYGALLINRNGEEK